MAPVEFHSEDRHFSCRWDSILALLGCSGTECGTLGQIRPGGSRAPVKGVDHTFGRDRPSGPFFSLIAFAELTRPIRPFQRSAVWRFKMRKRTLRKLGRRFHCVCFFAFFLSFFDWVGGMWSRGIHTVNTHLLLWLLSAGHNIVWGDKMSGCWHKQRGGKR